MIKVEVIGARQLELAMDALGGKLSDFAYAWDDVNKKFDQIESELFDSEGSSGAEGSWTPLERQYGRWKRVHYPGKRILERSGALRASLTSAADPNAVVEVTSKGLLRGSKLPYASTHLFGTHYVVQRKPIDLTEENQQELGSVFWRAFELETEKLGFGVRR